jgi:hypothetical protein
MEQTARAWANLTPDPSHFATMVIDVPAGTHMAIADNGYSAEEQFGWEAVLPDGTSFRVVTDTIDPNGERTIHVQVLPEQRARFRSAQRGGGVHHTGEGVSLSGRLEFVDHILALANSVQTAWENAAAAGMNHVLLVLKNNPASSVANALERPDVKEAIQNAGQEGAQAVITELQNVWEANGGDPNSAYLAKLLQDAQASGNMFASRITPLLAANEHAAAKQIMLHERLRAGAAGDVAESKAKTEAVLKQLAAKGGGYVRWRAHIDSKTCPYCLALDGKVVLLGQEFPIPVGLTPYLTLNGPPAHINCRCWLEPEATPPPATRTTHLVRELARLQTG